QHGRYWPEHLQSLRVHVGREPDWMTCAQIAFDSGNVIGELSLVVFGVGSSAHQPVLFVHPRDHSDSSFGPKAEPLDQLSDLHSYCDACAVIDRAGAQVPRVQMTGDNDYLLGMLAAFNIRDDVVALDSR